MFSYVLSSKEGSFLTKSGMVISFIDIVLRFTGHFWNAKINMLKNIPIKPRVL